MATSDRLDALADQMVACISAAHAPDAGAAQLQSALTAYETLKKDPAAFELACRLFDPRNPAPVQHFGFQVILAGLKDADAPMAQSNRAKAKQWLLIMLSPDRWGGPGATSPAPAYVQKKFSEVVTQVARADWPGSWAELTPALLHSCSSPAAVVASVALDVLAQIADLLTEDAKDMTMPRRREIQGVLHGLVEAPSEAPPSEAPQLVTAIQSALQQHGANPAVVRSALNLSRALAAAVPVQMLLQHNLDKIIEVGLGCVDYRGLAVAALMEWVEHLCPKRAANPATHDFCRFTATLAKLAVSCRFDGNAENYAFHKSVSTLLSNLCTTNAQSMAYIMDAAALGQVWKATLHMLRYPSIVMQVEALAGMKALAKAQESGGSPPRPPLEQLLGALFVASLRPDSAPAGPLPPEKSALLLQTLGGASTQEPLQSFGQWLQLLRESHYLDATDGDKDQGDRQMLFTNFRAGCMDLLPLICKPSRNWGSSEGYAALCRNCATIANRLLAAGWFPEYNQALDLLDSVGKRALAFEEKPAPQQLADKVDGGLAGRSSLLNAVVTPSLEFLKQVTSASSTSAPFTVEIRRLALFRSWAAFFKHWDEGFTTQVMQHITGLMVRPQGAGTEVLVREALDALQALGQAGAFRPQQVDALSADSARLSQSLSTTNQAKLITALAAASVSSEGVPYPAEKQGELITRIMSQPAMQWQAAILKLGHSDAEIQQNFVSLIADAALETGIAKRVGCDSGGNFGFLFQLRKLTSLFMEVATVLTTGTLKSARTGNGIANGSAAIHQEASAAQCRADALAQVWAPGILAITLAVAALPAAATGNAVLSAILRFPIPDEYKQMYSLSLESKGDEELPPGVERESLLKIRSELWSLRTCIFKAVRACCNTTAYWRHAGAVDWLRRLAEHLPSQRPHVAEMALREVYAPLFQNFHNVVSMQGWGFGMQQVPPDLRATCCMAVVPPVMSGMSRLLRQCWGRAAAGDAAVLGAAPVLPAWEIGFANSVLKLGRFFVSVLGSLAGSGMPKTLRSPERLTKQQQARPPPPQVQPKSKRRKHNKNQFAVLADDAPENTPESTQKEEVVPDEVMCLDPRVAAYHVVRVPDLRHGLRDTLVALLEIPDHDLYAKVMQSLDLWIIQLWNFLVSAENADIAVAQPGAFGDHDTPFSAGALLHATTNATRALPQTPLGRVLNAVTVPLNVESFGLFFGPLASLVQSRWPGFVGGAGCGGSAKTTQLNLEATGLVHTILQVLFKVYKIQCKKLQLALSLDHLYLNPALADCKRILGGLPNSKQHDVETLMKSYIENDNAEAQRLSVRALLHEASPAFLMRK